MVPIYTKQRNKVTGICQIEKFLLVFIMVTMIMMYTCDSSGSQPVRLYLGDTYFVKTNTKPDMTTTTRITKKL